MCSQCARHSRGEAGCGTDLFTYFNPILRYGLARFADDAKAAGADGVLVIDMIVEEAGEYLAEMARVGLAPVFLAAPTSPDERLAAIAARSKGFVYAISRTGITGKQTSMTSDAAALVERIRDRSRRVRRSCRWLSGSAYRLLTMLRRWRSLPMRR